MLNKKALERAETALVKAGDSISAKTRAAIEAYLAALPDEGGLIEEARRWLRSDFSGRSLSAGDDLLVQLADALEAARAKPGVPEGWWLAPKELTDDMIGLAVAASGNELSPEEIATIWDNLCAAAPEISDDR